MQFKWVIMFVSATLLIGCASHYIRSDADTLRIYLKAPQAGRVELLASFNGYTPLDARRMGGGTWMVAVPQKDSFTYFYRIDSLVSVPECDLTERDDFGQSNCVFESEP